MNATLDVRSPAHILEEDLCNEENYEIVDGERKELLPMSADSTALANRLTRALSNYGELHNIGESYTEMLFKLPVPLDRNRRPDVAFVPYSRWAKHRPIPRMNAWEVLPDLCVEVISPNDMVDEIMIKIQEYLQAGVRFVWIVYPRQQMVDVLESPTNIRRLSRNDVLEGGVVLPGFRLPLEELFPVPIEPSTGEATES